MLDKAVLTRPGALEAAWFIPLKIRKQVYRPSGSDLLAGYAGHGFRLLAIAASKSVFMQEPSSP